MYLYDHGMQKWIGGRWGMDIAHLCSPSNPMQLFLH